MNKNDALKVLTDAMARVPNCEFDIQGSDAGALVQIDVQYKDPVCMIENWPLVRAPLFEYSSRATRTGTVVITISIQSQNSLQTFFIPDPHLARTAIESIAQMLEAESDLEYGFKNGKWSSIYEA